LKITILNYFADSILYSVSFKHIIRAKKINILSTEHIMARGSFFSIILIEFKNYCVEMKNASFLCGVMKTTEQKM
jgi:hypothetical protein